MDSYKTLLVPTDFSPYTELALGHASLLARAFSTRLILLHVIPEETREVLTRTAVEGHLERGEEIFQRMVEASTLQLNALEVDLPEESVKRLVRVGHPVVEIVREAEQERVDVIVIPTHGRTGLDHVLFGSVAEKVVRRATCPVMVVRAMGPVVPQTSE
jgi:nucleotide-binding universal stress UspA family protein